VKEIEIGDADAATRKVLSRIVVGRREELDLKRATLYDQPAFVAERLPETQSGVELRCGDEVATREVGCGSIGRRLTDGA